jgi:hypothetical protein
MTHEVILQTNHDDDTVTVLVDGATWDRVYGWKAVDWQGLLRKLGVVVHVEDVTPKRRQRTIKPAAGTPSVPPEQIRAAVRKVMADQQQDVTKRPAKKSSKRAARKV